MNRSIVLALLVIVLTAVLFGCGMVSSAAAPELLERLLFDVSDGSGVTEASAAALVDAVLPEVVRRRGRVEFYGLDDVQGAVLAGSFRVGSPLRASRSALAAFERDRLVEGRRSFVLVRGALFSSRPHTSPLATALTVMSADVPRDAEVRYYLASDGREWSAAFGDCECRPPTVAAWLSRLHAAGALLPGSLRGSTVYFVGVRPLMPVPGNRCRASLALMSQTRTLWTAAITNAGGKVVFARDSDSVTGESVLFFLGSGMLFWRKIRVRFRATRDRKKAWYAPLAIIYELLGPRPGLDPSDPAHEEALARIAHLRLLVPELAARLRDVREALTQHPRWWHLASGVAVSIAIEGFAWSAIYRDGGTPIPERYFYGIMSGFFFLIMVMVAAKHAEQSGNRRWLLLGIIGISVVAIAATIVRVMSALTTGGDLLEEIAFGILVLCAAVGPAAASEWLLRPLRVVLPIVRLCRELRKQLRDAKAELDTITRQLSREAKLRRSWDWEYHVLLSTYDGTNPPPPGAGTTQQPNMLQGGAPWPDSASSPTPWVS